VNLILIAIDACRGDHLHCNGYPRETSPCIDQLAAEGSTFTDVTPAWPYTAISYTSMITGWYPFNHKMIANPHGVHNANDFLLDETIWSIAQVALDAGYRTASFDSLLSFWSHSKQFVRGYQHLFNPTTDSKGVSKSQLPAEAYIGEITHWLERFKDEKFFMFVHYWDTHQPFVPPERFKRWTGTEGWKLRTAADGVEVYEGVGPKAKAEEPKNLETINGYDGEVLHADHYVGEIVKCLKAQGIYDDTAIIVTADHGELMVEGPVDSVKFCMTGTWHPTMNIPLVVRVPGIDAKVKTSKALMHHVDIAPTLCDVLGLEWPDVLDGESVLPIMRGEKDKLRDAVIGMGTYGHVPQRFIKTADHKFMVNLRPEPYAEQLERLMKTGWRILWPDPPKVELTDRKTDPEERKNLAEERPDLAKKMAQLLDEELKAKMRGPDPFRPEMRERIWMGESLWN